jgi:hypothetical protein
LPADKPRLMNCRWLPVLEVSAPLTNTFASAGTFTFSKADSLPFMLRYMAPGIGLGGVSAPGPGVGAPLPSGLAGIEGEPGMASAGPS